eukprot:scaffold10640_cov3908-Chaetoceros_neogracile.AAC.1
MDEGIKAMIRFELNKGKRHASERQSILEMIETCDERIPDFMQPDLQDLQSYVSSLLNPGKNTSSAEGRTTSIFTSETTDIEPFLEQNNYAVIQSVLDEDYVYGGDNVV